MRNTMAVALLALALSSPASAGDDEDEIKMVPMTKSAPATKTEEREQTGKRADIMPVPELRVGKAGDPTTKYLVGCGRYHAQPYRDGILVAGRASVKLTYSNSTLENALATNITQIGRCLILWPDSQAVELLKTDCENMTADIDAGHGIVEHPEAASSCQS